LQSVIDDVTHVHTINANRSCHVPTSALGYALQNNDLELAKVIIDYKNLPEKPKRVAAPRNTLSRLDTGSYTYGSYGGGHNSRAIGAARGGKEGNNAFGYDGNTENQSATVTQALGHPNLSLDTYNYIVCSSASHQSIALHCD
jgi:hypothetical protein